MIPSQPVGRAVVSYVRFYVFSWHIICGTYLQLNHGFIYSILRPPICLNVEEYLIR